MLFKNNPVDTSHNHIKYNVKATLKKKNTLQILKIKIITFFHQIVLSTEQYPKTFDTTHFSWVRLEIELVVIVCWSIPAAWLTKPAWSFSSQFYFGPFPYFH